MFHTRMVSSYLTQSGTLKSVISCSLRRGEKDRVVRVSACAAQTPSSTDNITASMHADQHSTSNRPNEPIEIQEIGHIRQVCHAQIFSRGRGQSRHDALTITLLDLHSESISHDD